MFKFYRNDDKVKGLKMDFYKILNKTENHNGLQYKIGLNIDPVTFNPSGDCQPGGIYFAREDILAFLRYGVWIRKVTLPEDARVYKNPGTPKKWKADRVILGRKDKITAKVIKRLIEEGADPKVNDNHALQWAAKNGYFKIVKILLAAGVDPKENNNSALHWAAEYGHLKIVKLLLKTGAKPTAENSLALLYATQSEHLEIVKITIKNRSKTYCRKQFNIIICNTK
ncbi:ankyrin repeat domain-containing protein [Patescibacteria group bacterium]|nr:ankyrin repeat domain-containing protein [Patescibacteria group bacterium]